MIRFKSSLYVLPVTALFGIAVPAYAAAPDPDLVTVTPKKSEPAAPATPAPTADPGEVANRRVPITVHGEVGASIDSRGGKAAYGAVDIAIGDNANVSLAYGASKGRGYANPYGYGYGYASPLEFGWAPWVPYGTR